MKAKVLLVGLLFSAVGMSAQTAKNPVTAAARAALERQSKNLVEAAQEMPPDKFSYKPTPEQMTYGALMAHIANSNVFLCGRLAPESSRLDASHASEQDPKDKLVVALKSSFDLCSKALDGLSDSRLADDTTLFGNRPGTKADALLALTNDWADHYGAAAIYLRLNGLLPPTAKKK